MKSFTRIEDTNPGECCNHCDVKASIKVGKQSLCEDHASVVALHEVLTHSSVRHRLPDRRTCHTVRVVWRDSDEYQVSIGFAQNGTVREVFTKGSKVGSDMDAQLDDTCVLLSRLLQFGDSIQDLAKSHGREGADPHTKTETESPVASLIGKIANAAAAEEIIYKVQVARFYKT